MSSYASNPHYGEYKHFLSLYSACIKPVLKANYERMVQDLPDMAAPLDQYCVAERRKVEELRSLIKNSSAKI